MTDTGTLTPAAYLRELTIEAQRLSREESDELVLGMSAHVAELEAQGLAPAEMSKALAALGEPRQVVDEFLAVAGATTKPYRSGVVVAALVCSWVAVLSSFLLHPWLLSSFGATGLMVGVAVASTLNGVSSLAVLVTTIVAGMWRRWIDGVTALILVVVGPFAPALVLGSLTSFAVTNTADRVVARTLLAVAVICLLLSTTHWSRRLLHQSGRTFDGAVRLRVLGAALMFALIAAAVVVSPTHVAGDGKVRVKNDFGRTVHLTFCPRQDCSGQKVRELEDGGHLDFDGRGGRTPDSVVVEDGDGFLCGLLPMADEMSDPQSRITGEQEVNLSDNVDRSTCGADVDSLAR